MMFYDKRFLRVDTVLNVSGTWPRLLTPRHAPQFQELFQKYAIRFVFTYTL